MAPPELSLPPRRFVAGASSTVRRPSGAGLVHTRAGAELAAPPIASNDLAALQQRIEEIRRLPVVHVEELGRVAGLPLTVLHFGCHDPADPPKLKVLVTAGVHGNEPCGPPAALVVIQRLLAHPELLAEIELTVVPVVNPVGFCAGTRRNGDNIDLNRQFASTAGAPTEVELVRRVIAGGGYDLALDLHSGKPTRDGFWALHRGSREVLDPAMRAFARRHPVLRESTRAYDFEAPGIYRSRNGGTLKDHAADRGAQWSMTLEAPGSLSYRDQVTGMADLVEALIEAARRQSGGATPGQA